MKYKRRILITGGAGNVGGSLATRLAQDPENYVVVVEIRASGSKSGDVLYFGTSQIFALTVGKHKEVTVNLQLTSTPDIADGSSPEGAVSIVGLKTSLGKGDAGRNAHPRHFTHGQLCKCRDVLLTGQFLLPVNGIRAKRQEQQ